MKNVSNEFRNIIAKGGPFYAYARITLANGTELELNSNDDFSSDGNGYSESGGGGFPLGVAMAKTIEIAIENLDGRFSDYDFNGAKIVLYTEVDVDNGVERIKEGTFTVIDAVALGEAIEISASDDMYKADMDYVCKIDTPFTSGVLLRDVCSQCGISLGSASFVNDNFVITEKPTGITCRQAIGYVAQIAAGNAVIDENSKLQIKTYNFPSSGSWIISGGEYQDGETDILSGGSFGDNIKSVISGGKFKDSTGICVLSEFSSDPDIAVDDVTITGISVNVEGTEEKEESTLLYGTDEYALTIENPLILKNEETAISLIGDILIGLKVRPFSGSFFPNPTIQFMDPAYLIDKNDNVYQTFITDNTFDYLGGNDLSNDIPSPEKNRSSFSGSSTQVYKKLKNELNKNKTEWEKAVSGLEEDLKNSSGLYQTTEEQPDGSNIYYFHDKKTLAESKTIIKITSQAIGVSTDGGATYPVGLRVDGEAIIKILQTIGVNADWINAGTLIIRDPDGNVMLYADTETGSVRIVAETFSIRGKTIEEIAGEQVNDFVSSVYNPAISNLQSQIDGQIETWYYDYQPTLSNVPASSWKTEADRAKHEGDLFYWKSKGYSYRFFKDGSTWKWQMVQDTDITKALATANEAQDTADNKRRVFVSTPAPPYDIGDLWTQGTNGDIMRCQVSRQSGSYVSSDWVKASKYTDNSALNAFISGDFKETIDEIQKQTDGKAETWYQSTDPSSSWTTTALKQQHIGDIWFNTSSSVQKSYRWNGSSWQEMKTTPPPEVFDEIDGKAQIFVSTPKPPYSVGDLWFNSTTSDIMTCITARSSGSYTASDWQKRNKYTDDSAVTRLDQELNSTEEIFNRLTQNGKIKGIYLQNGQLYISFDYAKGGTLVLGGSNNISGTMKILSSDGKELCVFDNTGGKITGSLYTEVENYWGREWISIDGPLIESGIGEEKIATFDMAAQYSDGVKLALTCQNGIIVNSGNNYMSFKEQEFSVTTDNSISVTALGSGLRLDGSSMELWGNSGSLYSSYSEGFKIQTLNGMSVQSSSGIANGTTLHVYGSILVEDAFLCKGTKSRICETKDYSTRKLYCYETASPLFGDVGCGLTDENGECYVEFDSVFAETVNMNCEYQVFLQKEGKGDIWVEEKTQTYFKVKGTENLKFSWEVKSKQKGYELNRLDDFYSEDEIYDIGYEKQAFDYVKNYLDNGGL